MRTSLLASLALLFTFSLSACGDDAGTEAGDGGTGTETGDTGTSDEVGESSSTSSTSTTSTDETTTTTSTDTGSCPVGSEGCPCTGGGGCDPGLVCEGDVCTMPAGTDTTTDTGTTDPTTTDTTTTDTGMDPMPYQACPNGDGDCAPGEVCVTGAAMMGQVPWTMCTSGTCMADGDCAVDDNDVCADLPGDGQPIDYCVPFLCDQNNPCTDPMVCVQGFGGGAPSVCVWPA